MTDSYLLESMDYAFDGCGLFEVWNAIPEAKRKEVVDSLSVSLENESQAKGWDAIPNPMDAEMRERDRRAKENLEWVEKGHANKVRELEETISSLRWRISNLQDELSAARGGGWR